MNHIFTRSERTAGVLVAALVLVALAFALLAGLTSSPARAMPPTPRPAGHTSLICEGIICEPAADYWGGPRDWTVPGYGTVGPHTF